MRAILYPREQKVLTDISGFKKEQCEWQEELFRIKEFCQLCGPSEPPKPGGVPLSQAGLRDSFPPFPFFIAQLLLGPMAAIKITNPSLSIAL